MHLMTISIPPELEKRLIDEASRRGVAAEQCAAELIAKGLPAERSNQASLELLAKWDAEEATDDPAEIERRRRDAEDFMQSLARSRVEMEGPKARRLWPCPE